MIPRHTCFIAFLVTLAFSLFGLPGLASAHHSVDSAYDETRLVDIEGELTAASWRNPHVRMTISVKNDDGTVTPWGVEMLSISTLRRRGVNKGFVEVGDTIKVHGIGGRGNSDTLHARNILRADSAEVILETNGKPHWGTLSKAQFGLGDTTNIGDQSAPQLGIFRVWSSPTNIKGSAIWPEEFPLNPAGLDILRAFDPDTDLPKISCEPKGMPTAMEQPYPMEFIDGKDTLTIKLEEFDTVRHVAMTDTANIDITPQSLGVSKGHWQGDTLIVTTDLISWPYITRQGVPLSPEAVLIEYFTVSKNGSRLNYKMIIDDETYLTEPIILEKYWLWFPKSTVSPYHCEG